VNEIEYLKARYDEAEGFAKRASKGPWNVDHFPGTGFYSVRTAPEPSRDLSGQVIPGMTGTSEVVKGMTYVENSASNVAFVAHNDPAAVLTQLSVLRKIAEMHEPQPAYDVWGQPVDGVGCSICDIEPDLTLGGIELRATGRCQTLLALLQAFSDRDDFPAEWAW